MKLETASCPLCGADGGQKLFEAPALRLPGQFYQLVTCERCQLVRTTPRPAPDEMAKLYGSEFYSAPARPLAAKLNKAIARERVVFLKKWKSQGSLLDVGCGSGGFLLEALNGGYDGHGLEPYQASTEGLPPELRNRIRCTSFEAADYPPASFDLITLFHVLEHLATPVDTLRRLRGFLKPGGLLVLEVPNLASPEARWLGPLWYNLDVPYHFTHFSPQTLAAVVEKAGLHVVATRTSALTAPVWLLNYLLLGSNAISRKLGLHRGLSLLLCLCTRILWSRSCPMVRVVCRAA